jgi:ketosteroid isomerase-like protein
MFALTLSDDVDWHMQGPQNLPYCRPCRGPREVVNGLRSLYQTFAIEDFQIETTIAGGDSVVVVGHGRGTVRQTGKPYEANWVDVLTITNGRISRYGDYGDWTKPSRRIPLGEYV